MVSTGLIALGYKYINLGRWQVVITTIIAATILALYFVDE